MFSVEISFSSWLYLKSQSFRAENLSVKTTIVKNSQILRLKSKVECRNVVFLWTKNFCSTTNFGIFEWMMYSEMKRSEKLSADHSLTFFRIPYRSFLRTKNLFLLCCSSFCVEWISSSKTWNFSSGLNRLWRTETGSSRRLRYEIFVKVNRVEWFYLRSNVEERCEPSVPWQRNSKSNRFCPDINEWNELDVYEIGNGGGFDLDTLGKLMPTNVSVEKIIGGVIGGIITAGAAGKRSVNDED